MVAIRSMTGYGQGSADLPEGRVSVELRSLNHRYADLRLRLPSELAAREATLRRRVLDAVRRGRVELTVTLAPADDGETRAQLNRPLLDAVLEACAGLSRDHGLAPPTDAAALLAVPGMFKAGASEPEWGESELGALDRALGEALAALDAERVREGGHLRDELLARLATMDGEAAGIRERARAIPGQARDRLLQRLRALLEDVELEPARLAQEAAILADRGDVTEELVRLEGHLAQVRELLVRPDGEPLGRRLDFLLQEIHRETNTINSKAQDLELSRRALALKAELEKMREQVQNLE